MDINAGIREKLSPGWEDVQEIRVQSVNLVSVFSERCDPAPLVLVRFRRVVLRIYLLRRTDLKISLAEIPLTCIVSLIGDHDALAGPLQQRQIAHVFQPAVSIESLVKKPRILRADVFTLREIPRHYRSPEIKVHNVEAANGPPEQAPTFKARLHMMIAGSE